MKLKQLQASDRMETERSQAGDEEENKALNCNSLSVIRQMNRQQHGS